MKVTVDEGIRMCMVGSTVYKIVGTLNGYTAFRDLGYLGRLCQADSPRSEPVLLIYGKGQMSRDLIYHASSAVL